MVYFTCSRCQETLKKKAAETHGCGGAFFSCVDCMQTFDRRTIKGHTSCLTGKSANRGLAASQTNSEMCRLLPVLLSSEEQKFHGKFAKAKGQQQQQQKQQNGCPSHFQEGGKPGKRKLEAMSASEPSQSCKKQSKDGLFDWKGSIDAALRKAPEKQLPWRQLVCEV